MLRTKRHRAKQVFRKGVRSRLQALCVYIDLHTQRMQKTTTQPTYKNNVNEQRDSRPNITKPKTNNSLFSLRQHNLGSKTIAQAMTSDVVLSEGSPKAK